MCSARSSTSASRALGLALLAAAAQAGAGSFTQPVSMGVQDPGTFMGVELHGTLEVDSIEVDGIKLTELSALAWDADEKLLYALSDDGALFHLRPRIERGMLVDLDALAAYRLRDAAGAPLAGRASDAEGLDALGADDGRRGNTRLLVSFERVHRVAEYRPDGRFVSARALPAPLDDPSAYRSPNNGLESLAVHPALGVLVAPERTMRGAADGTVTIRSLDGRRWTYPLRGEPNSALVDLCVTPSGSVLALERAHGPFFLHATISLREIRLPDTPNGTLAPRTVAVFDTARGWSIDNFEGLAHQTGNHFFMVSDDNDRPIQRTLLVYLELLEGSHDFELDSREFEVDHEK